MMKNLMDARLFAWLEESGKKDVTREEVELVVGEFMVDLERVCDKEKNYLEKVRVLERVRIRLHVWDEVCHASDGPGKKGDDRVLRGGGVATGGGRDPVFPGAAGIPGEVCRESG
ncbi:MAG: hypothetical protein KH111_03230 [Bacteroidales bacterium]|nr:hypothetical protein [Bacteroidales bacterium]